MKTYISGPITGVPDYNRTAFATAAKSLLAQGRAVFNPTENGLPESATWDEHMRADIKALMDCDVIHMLPGWHRSRGASLERYLALQIGMTVDEAGEI